MDIFDNGIFFEKRTKINQKRPGLTHFLKKHDPVPILRCD